MCTCVFMCMCVYVCMWLWVWLRVTTFRTLLVRSGPLQEIRTQFGFVLVVGPIHRRFEDRSIGRSEDQYRFVQWRLNGDSDEKSCYFMWVFLVFLLSILILFYMSAFNWFLYTLVCLTVFMFNYYSCTLIIVHVHTLKTMNKCKKIILPILNKYYNIRIPLKWPHWLYMTSTW